MSILLLILIALAIPLGMQRDARKATHAAQIILGDTIAIKKGQYIKRRVRKLALKNTGKYINRFK